MNGLSIFHRGAWGRFAQFVLLTVFSACCILISSQATAAAPPGTAGASLPAAGPAAAEDPAGAKRILLVFPFNLSYAQLYTLSSGFFDRLNSSGESYRITQLELDSFNRIDPDEWQRQFARHLPDLRAGRFDVIVTFGGNALETVRRNFDSIPPETQLVVCGQSSIDPELREQHPESTGLVQPVSPAANLEFALKLLPKTRKVAVLTNWTPDGKLVAEKAEAFFREHPELEPVRFDNETDDTGEMLRKIAALPPGSLVLFYGWFNRKAVNFSSLQHLMTSLENNPNVPVLVMHDAMLRYGVLGGVMARARRAGEETADLVVRLLRGEQASKIPVRALPLEMVLNYRELERYRIPSGTIPEEALVIGKPAGYWKQHGKVLFPILAFAVVATVFAVAFAVVCIRLRRLGTALRNRMRQITFLNGWLEEVIVRGADSDAEILRQVKNLSERLRAAHVIVRRFDEKSSCLIPLTEWLSPLPPELACLAEPARIDRDAPWYRLLLDRRTLRLPQVASLETAQIYGKLIQHIPLKVVRSLYSAGIWKDGRLWGALTAFYSTPHPRLDESETALLTSAAHMLEIILERRSRKKTSDAEPEENTSSL